MPSNFAKTGLLLVVLTLIFIARGALVGGREGLVIAFIVAIATNLYSFWNSDTVVLKMFGAQELSRSDAPQLFDTTATLAQRAGLPMPRLYLLNTAQPNAFATGRNPSNSAVAVSTGLLDRLDMREVAGVVAHELAHVRNRDTLTMTVAATIAGAISMFATFLQWGMLFGDRRNNGPLGWIGALVAILLAPFAAMLVQMAVSRSREYEADRIGAYISGNPIWLANALRKIQAAATQIPYEDAEHAPAAAHVFIINPLTGRGFDNLFTTHPNTENRIAELERLAAEWQQAGSDAPAPLDFGRSEAPPPGPWSSGGRAELDGGRRGPWG
ncbi:MAG: zinc metalloprotease HtpX [Hyphomicrobiaceae bacterium]